MVAADVADRAEMEALMARIRAEGPPLRGIVHAGAGGDETAIVCALALAPMQLRISRHIARLPDVELDPGYEDRSAPEVASVQDGQIVVELWGTK